MKSAQHTVYLDILSSLTKSKKTNQAKQSEMIFLTNPNYSTVNHQRTSNIHPLPSIPSTTCSTNSVAINRLSVSGPDSASTSSKTTYSQCREQPKSAMTENGPRNHMLLCTNEIPKMNAIYSSCF
ncbi:hypothetical protein PCASD_18543 [Puccinia coronata f. sp. avenae]|uniref:Uncharacterized protein n=1 Tax=Puccinia coronata f. sp. avenae TaxID=200324 RepID=A0A2N5U101_9BASI|nr:hypothetical protein PCASD_18543 [Puccinia coronata f. sp. avenae]